MTTYRRIFEGGLLSLTVSLTACDSVSSDTSLLADSGSSGEAGLLPVRDASHSDSAAPRPDGGRSTSVGGEGSGDSGLHATADAGGSISGADHLVGIFTNANTAYDIRSYEASIGYPLHKPDFVDVHLPGDSFASMESVASDTVTELSQLENYDGTNPKNTDGPKGRMGLVISLPMNTNGGGGNASSIADIANGTGICANGQCDQGFERVGKTLLDGGYGDIYIRLGWEFSGNWMSWSVIPPGSTVTAGLVTQSVADWKAAWKRIVTDLRSVADANGTTNFKFVWCTAAANAETPLEDVYPGDDYVDVIGTDIYNSLYQYPAPAEDADPEKDDRWALLLQGSASYTLDGKNWTHSNYGLTWLANFAATANPSIGRTKALPLSVDEWGSGTMSPLQKVDGHPNYDVGGGDDSCYVDHMIDWIHRNNVHHSSYFDSASANFNTFITLFPGSPAPNDPLAFPNNSAAYVAGYPQLASGGPNAFTPACKGTSITQ